MALRQLREEEVFFTLEVEEDTMEVRGNALCSGDPAVDKAAEDVIVERLRCGDTLAWAWVKVTVTWRSFQASASLGGCSYNDKQEFLQCDYYKALKEEALSTLQTNLQTAFCLLQELACAE